MHKTTYAVADRRSGAPNDRYIFRRESGAVVVLRLVSNLVAVVLAAAMILAVVSAVITSR